MFTLGCGTHFTQMAPNIPHSSSYHSENPYSRHVANTCRLLWPKSPLLPKLISYEKCKERRRAFKRCRLDLGSTLFGQRFSSAVLEHLKVYARPVSVKYVWFESRTRMTLPHSSHQSTYLQLASKLAVNALLPRVPAKPSLSLRRLELFWRRRGLKTKRGPTREKINIS